MSINKKIVHISLNSLFTDGWSYQDQQLSKYHKKMGMEVTDITSHWINDDKGNVIWDERDEYVNDDGVKVIRLKMQGKDEFTKKLKRFEGLMAALEKEKPDILFLHSVSFQDTTVIVDYVKKHPDVVVYADNHADFSNSATNWISKNILHKIVWKHYARKLIPYVTKFYGVMPARVDFLKNIYGLPEDKLELLVMGVDDDDVPKALSQETRREIRNKYGIADDDILIITGGKIDMAKRQTVTLMKVINKMANPKIKLIVFGSVVDELRDAVNAEISDNCQYIGWIDSNRTLEYYGSADLVVFPGRHSVFWEQVVGIGKPMICKYWDGTTHVDLGGNVKFLYEDTEEELEKVITTVLNSPEVYNNMKQIAETKGMKTFSYSQIAKQSMGL
ncbi:glycosyltransferase family 4 protein [Pseudobutyrivibrio xylanivorans]|uniref:Glycosyltransferase involved in cell wall bisynthesis n=1 Tax=Pseudobutyrivibrio xylanivorans DSM 14809 TaxID=1123012 RepID=A0A1M6JRX8_PSEXY|nr:glycosyltransferase family 4 protein [Pseudobutyrivibrio xylanivorans]SHJ49396.1 Glycosyltransferase involved in cell wall bisynthesis [Pseudobutyrivibrio xylanivorans DSM 14809]